MPEIATVKIVNKEGATMIVNAIEVNQWRKKGYMPAEEWEIEKAKAEGGKKEKDK